MAQDAAGGWRRAAGEAGWRRADGAGRPERWIRVPGPFAARFLDHTFDTTWEARYWERCPGRSWRSDRIGSVRPGWVVAG
ncbi:hypothetical protein ALI22I_32825 [Saccharothrix sp. ALI-22-I]|nr:hypothetical protein ALI22I_32825 [Saccharothrix sp. ALI-22-I]